MNYNANELMIKVGITERQFHYWKRKGLIVPIKEPPIKSDRYTKFEMFVLSVIKEVLNNTRISVQTASLFRKQFTDLFSKIEVAQHWANGLYLIIAFQKKKNPTPWFQWYDLILCGQPLVIESIAKRHPIYYSINLESHWPE